MAFILNVAIVWVQENSQYKVWVQDTLLSCIVGGGNVVCLLEHCGSEGTLIREVVILLQKKDINSPIKASCIECGAI